MYHHELGHYASFLYDPDFQTHVSRMFSTVPNLAKLVDMIGMSINGPIDRAKREFVMLVHAYCTPQDHAGATQLPTFSDYAKWIVTQTADVPHTEAYTRTYYHIQALNKEIHWTEDPDFMAYLQKQVDVEKARQVEFSKIKTITVLDDIIRANWLVDPEPGGRFRRVDADDVVQWMERAAPLVDVAIFRVDDIKFLLTAFALQSKRLIMHHEYEPDDAEPERELLDHAMHALVRLAPEHCIYTIVDAWDDRTDLDIAREAYRQQDLARKPK